MNRILTRTRRKYTFPTTMSLRWYLRTEMWEWDATNSQPIMVYGLWFVVFKLNMQTILDSNFHPQTSEGWGGRGGRGESEKERVRREREERREGKRNTDCTISRCSIPLTLSWHQGSG